MSGQNIEMDVIRELAAQIGESNLGILVAKVQKDVPILWQQLTDATHCNDQRTILRSIHTLSSIFRSVGLLAIGDTLAGVESKLRMGAELDPQWLGELEPVKYESMQALELFWESTADAAGL